MSNTWFQFKQFKIDQDLCAMKVSTDACIFGALVAACLQAANSKKALDIGTGTGLLSLMLAQELPDLAIDAVEIEEAAYQQATSNVLNSPWNNRINVRQLSIQEFAATTAARTYDAIICNPPFFSQQLESKEVTRNTARHEVSLTRLELLQNVYDLITDNGIAAFLYPASEEKPIIELANNKGFRLLRCVKIYPNDTKSYNRVVIILTKENSLLTTDILSFINEDFYIRNGNTYSKSFIKLMFPYYLK